MMKNNADILRSPQYPYGKWVAFVHQRPPPTVTIEITNDERRDIASFVTRRNAALEKEAQYQNPKGVNP